MSPDVLSELKLAGVTWQARRSRDRGRLEVVGLVEPSAAVTVITLPTARELRRLLNEPDDDEHLEHPTSDTAVRELRTR